MYWVSSWGLWRSPWPSWVDLMGFGWVLGGVQGSRGEIEEDRKRSETIENDRKRSKTIGNDRKRSETIEPGNGGARGGVLGRGKPLPLGWESRAL